MSTYLIVHGLKSRRIFSSGAKVSTHAIIDRAWRRSYYGNKRWDRKAPSSKHTNSIMGRYEQLQDHSPIVDDVSDLTVELDRKAARYVRALASKNASQKAARAVLRQRARRQCMCIFE